jgi:hypothetical protein
MSYRLLRASSRFTLLAPAAAALALASAARATITYDRTGFTAGPATQWTVAPNCADTTAGIFSNFQVGENDFGQNSGIFFPAGGSLAQSFLATTSGALSDVQIIATGDLSAADLTFNAVLLDAGPAGTNGAGLANNGFVTYGNAAQGITPNNSQAFPVVATSGNLLSADSQGLIGPGYPANPAGSTLISWDFKFSDVDAVPIVAGHEYVFELNTPSVYFLWERCGATGDYANGQAFRSRSSLNGNPARDFALSVAVTPTGPIVSTWDGSTGNWSDPTHWSSNPVFPNNTTASQYAATINSGTVHLDVPATVSGLTLGGATGAWTGKLDLGASPLVVESDTTNKATAIATLQDQVAFGKTNGGANGITSSSVTADPTHKTIIVVDNALLGLTQFNGQAVDSNSVLVEATYFGDSNLDRKVDVTDLGTLATNYGKTVTNGALQGDFNGDGKVDVTDLGLLATDYGLGTSGGPFTVASVPEPASLSVLLLASIALCSRRKR